jgi:deoxyribodipyrimidine photo-lyase
VKLVWFREDLRISDNPALYHATKNDAAACIYIITPIMFKKHDISSNKLNFLMAGVKQLQIELKKLNIGLYILEVKEPKMIKKELLGYAKKMIMQHFFCKFS